MELELAQSFLELALEKNKAGISVNEWIQSQDNELLKKYIEDDIGWERTADLVTVSFHILVGETKGTKIDLHKEIKRICSGLRLQFAKKIIEDK